MLELLIVAIVVVASAPYAALWFGWRTEWNRKPDSYSPRHRKGWLS